MVGSTQRPERVDIPDVQASIDRLDVPSGAEELAARVEERGGNPRVAEVLRRLPDGRYASPAEVLDAVRELELPERDVPSGGIRSTGDEGS